MLHLMNDTQTHTQREGCCPSCGECGTFTYAGEQRWPPQVAEATGLPPVINLWSCDNCSSTISETDLE